MLVSAGYASLASIYGIYLVLNVVKNRIKFKVSIGDGSHEQLIDILREVQKDPKILENKKAGYTYFHITYDSYSEIYSYYC
jgi:uncharacterized membrane protein YecN with MAPEG domain